MAERRLETSDKFFDIIDDVKKTWWVTIGYVTGANVNVPKVKRKNPDTNRMKGYPDYTAFKKEGYDQEIGAMVSITSYNFQYFPTNIAKQKYGEYKNAANAIRREFGIPEIQDKENDYTQTINYGNGISAYGGKNPEKMGHTYTNQNIYDAKIKGITYLVSTDGNIIRGLSNDEVKPYLKAKREIDGVAALRKINAQQEVIDNYISRIKELKYKYKRFESSSILWMVATTKTDNEKIVYINDKLQRAVDDININPESFIKIAEERYKDAINEMVNKRNKSLIKENKLINKKIVRLTESQLKNMIIEAVNNYLDNDDPFFSLVQNYAKDNGYEVSYNGIGWSDDEDNIFRVPLDLVVDNLFDAAPMEICDAYNEDDYELCKQWLYSNGDDVFYNVLNKLSEDEDFWEINDYDDYEPDWDLIRKAQIEG